MPIQVIKRRLRAQTSADIIASENHDAFSIPAAAVTTAEMVSVISIKNLIFQQKIV